MKPLKIIFAVTGAILAVTFIAASWFIGRQVSLSTTQLITNEASGEAVTGRQWEKYRFDGKSFEREYGAEDFELTSTHDGHAIPVSYSTPTRIKRIKIAIPSSSFTVSAGTAARRSRSRRFFSKTDSTS